MARSRPDVSRLSFVVVLISIITGLSLGRAPFNLLPARSVDVEPDQEDDDSSFDSTVASGLQPIEGSRIFHKAPTI